MADPYTGHGSASEELWIIARPEGPAGEPLPPPDDTPGTGALMADLPGEEKDVPVPLRHTDVKASIAGYIATVGVKQEFYNPYEEKIEAVYVFPLPGNSAVNEFIMTVGERRIRGIIRERKEAERIYQEARSQGYVASLLTQERPNIFTQKVANIEPGKRIDVDITYFSTLAYHDGWYEFVFPMVVGPRFNPSGSTQGVGAIARDASGGSGQPTDVHYLKPGERSGHDVSLSLAIDAGVAIEEVVCRSHTTHRSAAEGNRTVVELSELDSIPNKDFVLRYRVAGERIKSALMTHSDTRGGFFTMMVYPPADIASLPRRPMEMVFVIDCSGSMSGAPIAQAKAAVERALLSLQPDDRFQVIRFSVNASTFGPRPVPATAENVRRAVNYVKELHGGGGTMMIEGIRTALNFPHDERRFRFVSFMTDGFIGNEDEILAEVKKNAGPSRIFSFGVGSSPNRYLLNRMAKVGRGAVAYLGLRDSASDVMDAFFARVSHPAMTDLSIDWGGAPVSDVFPRRIPDLFAGRPIIVTGRCEEGVPERVTVSGQVADGRRSFTVAATAAEHKALPSVWARMKIADLAERALDGAGDLEEEIKSTALTYGLMSAYTAFVAVDSLTQTAGDHGTTVPVPVPVPDGVRYDTTVME